MITSYNVQFVSLEIDTSKLAFWNESKRLLFYFSSSLSLYNDVSINPRLNSGYKYVVVQHIGKFGIKSAGFTSFAS